LKDWELPPVDLWAVFPTGRLASAKARAFADFVETSIGQGNATNAASGQEQGKGSYRLEPERENLRRTVVARVGSGPAGEATGLNGPPMLKFTILN